MGFPRKRAPKRILGSKAVSLMCTISGLSLAYSHSSVAAIGKLQMDSSSFMYRSSDRGTASTWFEAQIADETKGKYFEAKADLSAYTFITTETQPGFEARDFYVATRAGAIGGHQLTVGRKKKDWSNIDSEWQMMSLWSPRFSWDQLYPYSVGMTGAFYEFRSRNFDFTLFGSPISIPERGTPLSEVDGKIVSNNPFWSPPPSEISIFDTPTRINYRLDMPSYQEILLRPQFAVQTQFKYGNGFFTQINAGVLPVHMVQLAAEPRLDVGGSAGADLNVTIKPQFPMRNINTLETGYVSPSRDWRVWGSASYEQPFQFQNQTTWLNPVITPAQVFSAGTEMNLTKNFVFSGGFLIIKEDSFTRSSDLPNVNVNLPSRFPLKQGFKVAGKWRFSDYQESNLQWIQDLIEQNHFASIDFQKRFKGSSVTVGLGVDILITSSTQGWVGQYYGDDRLRGFLRYAF